MQQVSIQFIIYLIGDLAGQSVRVREPININRVGKGAPFYGWKQWNKLSNEQYEIRIKKWKKINHLYAVGIVVILAIISKDILEKYTNAVFPFLDALTTFGAIITTYMVAKKIIENWIYWFVIDSISIYLFYSRELYLTSILFFIYLIIIIFGYKSWNRKLKENK